MAQIGQSWSTNEAPPAKAFHYWKDFICENLLQLAIVTAHESEFSGSIAQFGLGPFKGNFISVTEQRVSRTRPARHNAGSGSFHLIHIRRGVQHVEQYDRCLTVAAGNCVLIDCLSSFDFKFPEGVDALVLEIPRDWIVSWLPAPEDAAARLIDAKTGWGATLGSALNNLRPASVGTLALPQSVVAEQIAALLALAVVPEDTCLTTSKRSLLRRIRSTLRERCHDPDLDPAAVASALGLSRRYVHRLFAAAGTTFTSELYSVRLERAQRLLVDKRFNDVSIAEIAWSCGFSVPSHFTRRFRDHFGVPPTTFRVHASV